VVFFVNFFKSCLKISCKTAANATGVDFRNLDSSFLQKSAVDTDFTEFVLDKNNLLFIVSISNKFFDKCGFSRT